MSLLDLADRRVRTIAILGLLSLGMAIGLDMASWLLSPEGSAEGEADPLSRQRRRRPLSGLSFEELSRLLSASGEDPEARAFAAEFLEEPELAEAWSELQRDKDVDAFVKKLRESAKFRRLAGSARFAGAAKDFFQKPEALALAEALDVGRLVPAAGKPKTQSKPEKTASGLKPAPLPAAVADSSGGPIRSIGLGSPAGAPGAGGAAAGGTPQVSQPKEAGGGGTAAQPIASAGGPGSAPALVKRDDTDGGDDGGDDGGHNRGGDTGGPTGGTDGGPNTGNTGGDTTGGPGKLEPFFKPTPTSLSNKPLEGAGGPSGGGGAGGGDGGGAFAPAVAQQPTPPKLPDPLNHKNALKYLQQYADYEAALFLFNDKAYWQVCCTDDKGRTIETFEKEAGKEGGRLLTPTEVRRRVQQRLKRRQLPSDSEAFEALTPAERRRRLEEAAKGVAQTMRSWLYSHRSERMSRSRR